MTKTPELAVLVPVLGRPHRVIPTLDGFESTVPGALVLFLPSPDDKDEIAALQEVDAIYLAAEGNYARKIRAGVEATKAPLIFTAADDLAPRPEWFERAKSRLCNGVTVVGVNDLIRRDREHQTHFLMTREYAEQPTIDGEPGPFHQGYFHWNVDDELIATAKHRGVYAYAEDSIVKHLHPMVGTAPDDETYQRGRENWRADRKRFVKRQHLWT